MKTALCLHKSDLFLEGLAHKVGTSTIYPRDYTRFVNNVLPKAIFAQRKTNNNDIEYNTSYYQIIPYVVFSIDGRLLSFTRNTGDKRLEGKLTVGLGGHIESVDAFIAQDTMSSAVYREIQEEMPPLQELLPRDRRNLIPNAFIRTDSVETCKTHLGILYVVHTTLPEWRYFMSSFRDLKHFQKHCDKEITILPEALSYDAIINNPRSEEWTISVAKWLKENTNEYQSSNIPLYDE